MTGLVDPSGGRRWHVLVRGTATGVDPGRVVIRTGVGSRRVLDMLVGEQLPRIC